MTDHELLELAAKAAGIERGADRLDCGISLTRPGGRHESLPRWNPLLDDGDALRLAVALDFAVCVELTRNNVRIDGPSPDGLELVNAPISGDPYAATRRAIVRAAAEVERRK